ncbi:arginine--tRNA ligase [Salsipaludibacter albus]|uniref:arginine--tRNA ligase n=1 Tax=Salsipaludibacter albus TaxID=2849650 RepID=UPI001EE4744C|nr:arginine--tRNA ligase [Salsipaludibacter albus]MBY5163827.1 arginine--tRNA ligase [Salsipaludibacter albus]
MTSSDPVLVDLGAAIDAALAAADLPPVDDPAFERPRDPDHGDWASTLALRLAKPARMAPRAIADAVVAHLDLPDAVASVEIAGPGFLNFRLSDDHNATMVRDILARGRALRPVERTGERINVEFVSANPTGPLHIGHGRWAAVGDAVAELLAAVGHEVVREYYVNDAGGQVVTFGETLVLTARGEVLDDHHYQGRYVTRVATQLRADWGDEIFEEEGPGDLPGWVAALGGEAVDDTDAPHGSAGDGTGRMSHRLALRVGILGAEVMRQRLEGTLHDLGVDFDTWFSERRELHDTDAVADTLADLEAAGATYVEDGAVFLRTAEHGDDKDRVLVRANGVPTYFAADCAYLRNKFARADHLVYILGADHHGYVARLKAAAACLGHPPDALEARIGQMVNLLRDGEPAKMSKRAGTFVELSQVVDEVGADVTRYHFLRSGLDTALDFDLARVAEQSMDNPVYYVQYAHARISSLLRTADERGFDHGTPGEADFTRLVHPAEADLLRELDKVDEVVAAAAELRATQRLTRYAEDLAATFHRFYTECRVLVDDVELGRARYHLAAAARQVLADVLGLLRVSAPDRM